MTREPTAEQIEAMAEEAFARYAQARKEANEPLTTTPDPQSTGAEGEAPVKQAYPPCFSPPLGFSWEYRAVEEDACGQLPGWWREDITSACNECRLVKQDGIDVWVERRLVGPAERVEESQPGNGQ